MILYLVRHGIAIGRGDPKAPVEAERPLTAEGVKKTRLAALGLLALKPKPDLLITSPYVRAAQTAEIFAEALKFSPSKIRIMEALKPTGNPGEAIKELARLRTKEVMCFGHAPHMDQMILLLAGARGVFTQIRKAGVACFEHTPSRGKWEMLWLLAPKTLRQLAE